MMKIMIMDQEDSFFSDHSWQKAGNPRHRPGNPDIWQEGTLLWQEGTLLF
jgi:hypothetical protein